jgi:hypothetical protein
VRDEQTLPGEDGVTNLQVSRRWQHTSTISATQEVEARGSLPRANQGNLVQDLAENRLVSKRMGHGSND